MKNSKIDQLKRHLFLEHIKGAANIVDMWPAWKRDIWPKPEIKTKENK